MLKQLILFLFLFVASVHKAIAYSNLKTEAFCRSTISIADALNPFQIVLILDKLLHQNTIEARVTRKCIFKGYPIMIVDFYGLKTLKPVMWFPSFGSPRSSTLFISLSSNHPDARDTFSELSGVLDSYSKIWSRPIRPRWLNILFNEANEAPPSLEDFLRNSWKLMFLDLTILESRNFSQTIVHHYNPFNDRYTWKIYNETLPTKTNLFPDKLHNMYGYPLRTIFVHEPPTLFLRRNSTGHVTGFYGTDYWNIRMAAKIMNFTLVTLPTFADDYVNEFKRQSFTNMSRDIFNGVIDFSGNQLYRFSYEVLERSYSLRPESHCALVPVWRTSQVEMPHSSQVILFTGLYVVILKLASKGMKFDRQLWTWIYFIKLTIGVPVFCHPRVFRERVLMGCLIMLSLFYLSDFYSKITDMKLTLKAIQFKSFKDLDKAQLIPLVYPTFFNKTFRSFEKQHSEMKNLKDKSKLWYNPETCADYMMIQNQSVFCILPESLGKDMVEKFRSNSRRQRLRLMEPCFWIAWKSYAFTPGSPYVEKFDKVLVNVLESGLMYEWKRIMKPSKVLFNDGLRDKQKEINSVQMKMQMALVIGIGVTASASVLIAEIIIPSVKTKCLRMFKSVCLIFFKRSRKKIFR